MLEMGNGLVIFDLLLYMEELCKYDLKKLMQIWLMGIELRWWLYDRVMYCERLIIKWKCNCSLLYLLIHLWGILWWEQPQGREFGKRDCGWEFSKICGRGFGKKKKMWLSIQQIYGRGFGKRKRIVAEVSANLGGCQFDKQTWKRGKKKKKREKLVLRDLLHKCVLDSVTTYVWFKSLKLCLAIRLYYMDDWSYKILEKLLIDVWKWPLEVPIWCLCVSDVIERVRAKLGWPQPWVSGVTAVTDCCPESRPWVL